MSDIVRIWLICAFDFRILLPLLSWTHSPDGAGWPYLNVTELDSPEEMQIESDERAQQGGDDGDSSPTSAHWAGSECMADDDVALHCDGNDQPDGVVTDSVQRWSGQLTWPLRRRLHVQPPRLRSTHRHIINYLY